MKNIRIKVKFSNSQWIKEFEKITKKYHGVFIVDSNNNNKELNETISEIWHYRDNDIIPPLFNTLLDKLISARELNSIKIETF